MTSSEMYVVDVRTVEIHRAGNKLRITVGIREHEKSFERNQGICTLPPPPPPWENLKRMFILADTLSSTPRMVFLLLLPDMVFRG